MNAYELADKLQETEPYYSTDYKLFDKAATMLRQQADRIAELEKELYFKNYHEELPDTPVGIIGKIGDSPIHDLVHRTTPQIKELSDEEITEVLNDENIAEYHQGNWLVLPYAFARAILKKASDK
jgi:hypothetical protein